MKKIFAGFIAVLILIGLTSTALAQNYSFSVPEAEIHVYMENNGTITIEYYYLFQNNPGADEIDFVDIGMPGDSTYSLNDIEAEVEGQPVPTIEDSPYVDGVALGLEQYAIQPGDSGVVYMRAENVRDVFYYASTENEEDYASIQFQPNYFSSDLSEGSTQMTVTFHMPPGAEKDSTVWYTPSGWPGDDTPASGFDDQDRIVYQWSSSQASPSARYTFGAAFPAYLIPVDEIRTEQTVTFNPSNLLGTLIPIVCCGGFALLVGFIIYFAIKSAKKRRLKYLPPKIAIEGHGIKRGLTAVEAGILMEQPMDKILTMILFSVLRKNTATVTSRDPLEIEVADVLPEDLREYEKEFLLAFRKEKSKRRNALQNMMVSLVKSVGEKMKGFSRKETVTYYKEIMEKAWKQVEEADTPEVRAEKYSEAVNWTMLDRDYDQRTRRTFGSGPVFMPYWWWRADPSISRPSTTTVGGAARTASRTSVPTGGKSKTITLPSLPGSNAAASVVNSVSAVSAGVIGNVSSFTSGVTSKTNPAPKPSSSTFRSSGRGGGGGFSGGCACACACAGCACACAGGGR